MQLDSLLFFLLVICIGYFGRKADLLPESAADAFPAVLNNICYPAMILETFTGADPSQLLGTGLPVVVFTLAVTSVLFFGSLFLYRKLPATQKPILTFITGIGNVTYVAIPLMRVFLPQRLIFIAVVHGTVQDLLIWSLYHQLFLTNRSDCKAGLAKKLLLSPCLIAVAVGIILSAFRVPLPAFLASAVTKISATTSPIALLFLGMLIHRYGLLQWCRNRLSIVFALGKSLLLPCCVYLAAQFFLPRETALILALLFGSPSPLTSVVWAKEYRCDVKLAVDCCLASTISYLAIMSAAFLIFTSLGIL